jgi:hypothetical protein
MSKHKARKPPRIGSVFGKLYRGQRYRLRVIAAGDGIAFEVNKKIFTTPTAAAKSITNNEVNGWRFWHIG